jgi:putative transposase
VLTLQLENQRIFLKEKLILILTRLKRLAVPSVKVLRARFVHWTKPLTSSLPLGTLADLGRSKSELIAENALLRQQLIVLKRQVKRPVCTKADRILLVLLARAVRAWQQALLIVQEDDLVAVAS